jgi:hypothetical protein
MGMRNLHGYAHRALLLLAVHRIDINHWWQRSSSVQSILIVYSIPVSTDPVTITWVAGSLDLSPNNQSISA